MTTPRPKPPRLPEWATTTLEILEPSSGEKGTGWPRAFRVPADWWNWLNNLQYKWFRRTAVIATSNLMGRTVAPAGERMTMIKCFPYPEFSQGLPLESEPDSAERYHAWVFGIEGGANGYRISKAGIKAAPVVNVPPASSNAQPYDMIHDGTDFVMTAMDMTPLRVTIYWGPDIDDLSNRFDIQGAVVFAASRPTALAYDGTNYVVAGDEDEIVWSPAQDGPWTVVQLAAGGLELRDMKYSAALAKFCAVGQGGAGDAIFTSVDGEVWVQQVAPPDGEPAEGWGTIAVMPNGEFCVTGDAFFTGGVIMHSTTGGTVWVRTEPFPTGPGVGYNVLLAGDRLIVLTKGLPGVAPSGVENTTVYESYDNALTWQLVGMAALFNGDYQAAQGFVDTPQVPGGASFGFDGEQWFAATTITESATGIFGAGGYLSEMFMAREK